MSSNPAYQLRETVFKDHPNLLEWRNEPIARQASRNTVLIDAAEHQTWIESALDNPGQKLWICELGGESIGVVGFRKKPGGVWEISINLDKSFRDEGHGKKFAKLGIEMLRDEFEDATVIAWVRKGNRPSSRMFERLGFTVLHNEMDFFIYELAGSGDTSAYRL